MSLSRLSPYLEDPHSDAAHATGILRQYPKKGTAWTAVADLDSTLHGAQAKISTHLPALIECKDAEQKLFAILQSKKEVLEEIVEKQLYSVGENMRQNFKIIILGQGSPYDVPRKRKRGESILIFQARREAEKSTNMPGASVAVDEYIHSFEPISSRRMSAEEILSQLESGIIFWKESVDRSIKMN